MNALIRLNLAVIVGCLRVSFGCIEQSFPEGIITPYEGTILTTGKVCGVQYLLVFRIVSGYMGERLISGLRRKDWDIFKVGIIIPPFADVILTRSFFCRL